MRFKEPINYPGKYESKGIKINCAVCGTEFIKKCPPHKYCSDCAKKVRLRQIENWRKENSERIKEQNRRYSRNYYRMHRDKELERNRKYRVENKEKFKKYSRDYYAKNRDYLLSQSCSKYHDNCRTCPHNDCIRGIS